MTAKHNLRQPVRKYRNTATGKGNREGKIAHCTEPRYGMWKRKWADDFLYLQSIQPGAQKLLFSFFRFLWVHYSRAKDIVFITLYDVTMTFHVSVFSGCWCRRSPRSPRTLQFLTGITIYRVNILEEESSIVDVAEKITTTHHFFFNSCSNLQKRQE